eukprot:CAMPEP_0198587130 /NCGR_PEP_ID=MMETSP1462-20131121/131473_1 /TAXON_ID=1333877 /ORGANISM="Brandtodinium nutriculum, Strain RCC3387" /LENGTH=64 /DNA_ID=CAMNT_0044318599 /DNA_START=86 /DNA_END=276 /DNA_ORIENTATION=-
MLRLERRPKRPMGEPGVAYLCMEWSRALGALAGAGVVVAVGRPSHALVLAFATHALRSDRRGGP